MRSFDILLADAILILHVGIILFVIGAVPLVWVGYFLNWRFVRNFYFRAAHLLLIGFVAAQALLGLVCPLTIWENALRARGGADDVYEGSFIAHWLRRLIFYEADSWVFTAAYIGFFLLVLVTVFAVKPNRPAWWQRKGTPTISPQ
jgi:hypothetical protein